ncbi:MAG: hypothetical protein BGO25_16360 [Acidobacteriales bacterium 59-55]|nr:MAG: hypothetical protein BGO25_16360 [Acidobacteriales bacterium 59-55]
MPLKSFDPGPTGLCFRSPRARRMLLLSTLASCVFVVFGSLPCTAMPRQEQAAAALPPRPTIGITADTLPSVKVPVAQAPATPPVIVIGFLGGHVKKNNAVHREVQLAAHLRQNHPEGVYAQVFQNSHGDRAFKEIERLLDANHDGAMSPAEKQHAQIILYGHSWGASETVTMARQLQTAGIPVLLAILVDRVSKIGAGDPRIPANVAQAVNFYQLDGLLHGRATIRAADPASTEILGNYRFDYKDNPVDCDQYPWYARLFMGPHIEIENDPRVWNQVEALIRAKLPPQKAVSTALLSQAQ